MSLNITDTLVVIRSHVNLTTEHREFICKEVRAQLADSNVLVLPSHLGVEWMKPGQSFDPERRQVPSAPYVPPRESPVHGIVSFAVGFSAVAVLLALFAVVVLGRAA